MKSDNSENSAKAKTYNCSECTNSYASISGLRGHLRKKHGITNAKGKDSEWTSIHYPWQKVRRPFNILILYISLFDYFFSLDFPKNDFLSGVFLQCFHNV